MKKSNKNINETRVVCPNCGAEFEIPEHETTIRNGVAIGADSNMGTIYLKLKDRQEQLKTAGIDITKYFSMKTPSGEEKMMKWDGDVPVAVTADDPVMKAIFEGGTIPNHDLFRRWVMAQVFQGLVFEGYNRRDPGFTSWVHCKGYEYTWKMTEEELRVQAKLWKKDKENFGERNVWFNKSVAVAMADDYLAKLKKHIAGRKTHKCKGVPYIKIGGKDVFKSDVNSKIISPLLTLYRELQGAYTNTPEKLYNAFCRFNSKRIKLAWDTSCSAKWIDAYKGAGAFYTMKNLIMFHSCQVRDDKGRFMSKDRSLKYLYNKASEYKDEGWKLFGVMKKLIDDNHIDIKKKQTEWREAKKKRLGW